MTAPNRAVTFDLPRLTHAPEGPLRGGHGMARDSGVELSRRARDFIQSITSNIGVDEACGYLAASLILMQRYTGYQAVPPEILVSGAMGCQRGVLSGTPETTDSFRDVLGRLRDSVFSDVLGADSTVSGQKHSPALAVYWNAGYATTPAPSSIEESLAIAFDATPKGSVEVRVCSPVADSLVAIAIESDLRQLVEALCDYDGPVSRLDAFCTTEADIPTASDDDITRLDEAVIAHAARTPQAVAVRGREVLTYAELISQSKRICAALRVRGVRVEDRVGICMHRTEQVAVAILGVMMSGAAFVPLAPEDPLLRRRQIIREAGIRLVIVDDTQNDAIDDDVETVRPAECGDADEIEPTPFDAFTAAYVLYTSGSSGRPKGVIVEHRQLMAYVSGFLGCTGLRGPLACAMVQPLTVDSSLTCVGAAWVTGGELQILDRSTALDLDRLSAWRRQHRMSVLKIAPSHLRALQASGDYAAAMPELALVVGGEASDWRWLQEVQSELSCAVYNHYGPTETTVGVLMLPVASHRGRPWTTAALGRALDGSRVAVVDKFGMETPTGIRGEIVVCGQQVARGYQAQTPNSGFQPWNGVPAYWTGDYGFRETDGVICFAGRSDDQVKVSGFRIELGDVEAAVNTHPAVCYAIAVVHADPAGWQSLACAVQLLGEDSSSLQDLTAHCRRLLPDHMVPSRWLAARDLPRTAHGKIDRGAVAELFTRDVSVLGQRSVAPASPARSEVELRATITAIWSSILGRATITEHQNFFDAGGYSLMLIDLQRAIGNQTGRDVDLLDLFQHSTIAAQVELLLRSPQSRGRSDDNQSRRRRQEALARRRSQQLKARDL